MLETVPKGLLAVAVLGREKVLTMPGALGQLEEAAMAVTEHVAAAVLLKPFPACRYVKTSPSCQTEYVALITRVAGMGMDGAGRS